jgi:hypothetical protein
LGSLTRESFLRVRIRAKQSAMDIAVIRCRSQTVRGSKKEATDRGDLFFAYFQRKSRSSPACRRVSAIIIMVRGSPVYPPQANPPSP